MDRKVYHVTPVGDVWGVRRARRKRSDSIHFFKTEAIARAKRLARAAPHGTGEGARAEWPHSVGVHVQGGSASHERVRTVRGAPLRDPRTRRWRRCRGNDAAAIHRTPRTDRPCRNPTGSRKRSAG